MITWCEIVEVVVEGEEEEGALLLDSLIMAAAIEVNCS